MWLLLSTQFFTGSLILLQQKNWGQALQSGTFEDKKIVQFFYLRLCNFSISVIQVKT